MASSSSEARPVSTVCYDVIGMGVHVLGYFLGIIIPQIYITTNTDATT